jgi:regulator of cell morphogenesis and NO signaling
MNATGTAPSTISPQATFDPSARVGDIVATRPLAATFFERIGIDYCCGGKRTLAEACTARNLDPGTVAIMLEITLQSTEVPHTLDISTMTLTELADHIERTHHAYLKEDLPILVDQAERVAAKHGDREPALASVAETMRELTREMFGHMQKEERVLFPLVRQLEATGPETSHAAAIANSIRQMEAEHDSAGTALARLRELTNGFVPPVDACNTHCALLAGLARLEADLHQHVHKENNVLFPRALALEATARTAAV